MTSASKERCALTALELTVESIEDLVNSVVNARLLPANANRHATNRAQQEIADARHNLKNALEDLTTPVLRVIEGRPQAYQDGKLDEDKPLCSRCKKHVPCRPGCGDWAAAVRGVVARASETGTES